MLPFWQAIESVTKQVDKLSPFIWSNAVKASESKEKKSEYEIDSEVGEGDELGEPNYIVSACHATAPTHDTDH